MADNTTQTEEYVQLKLVINEESNKVLFAEAGKDFVDILCSFLTMPLGTIARLLQKDSNMGQITIGCLNSLYQSVVDLDKRYLWTDSIKELLLKPKNSSEDYCSTLKLNIDDSQPTEYFICARNYFSSECRSCRNISKSTYYKCSCGSRFDRSFFLKRFCKGFVNSVATFVITDDLINIIPNSAAYTTFSLLKNLGIITSSTKEMAVNVTKEKVVDLLKCALVSKSPLTDVFLGKKPSIERSRFLTCNAENSSTIQITIQLVIRKSEGNILFAHGDQDFADLLISFLTFPLGGIIRKLGEYSSMGSIGRLYKSIAESVENQYFISEEAKNRLIDPLLASEYKSCSSILPIKEQCLNYYGYYQSESYRYRSNDPFFITDKHYKDGGRYEEMRLHNNKNPIKEGFVKGPRTYLATDDLVIGPASPISASLLINRLQIPVDDLKEKNVTIGMKECLSILNAALTSTSALTNGLGHLLSEVMEEK
ncbi:unnamed protein product [Trifolium pratense]|uniref:Uncharacterized protein n=1 Tax=Trifolium pratense TaxID=57577 RepID=A0ACB0LLU6_TRIPR|nr:unnamed protein product [Trifolium pratense]